MNANSRKLFKGWLIHFAILLLAMNLFDSIDYLVRIQLHGVFYRNDDGSPVTLWQRLIDHNFGRPDNLYLLLFSLLVEIHHELVFNRRHWTVFLLSAVLLSSACIYTFSLFRNNPFNLFRAGTVFCSYLIAYSLVRAFIKYRLYSLNVRLSNSENELRIIRQQLNPHFLFNTLNYIYGTALQENAAKTAFAIEKLSGMMRQSLEGMREEFVPLDQEIGFIESYISLVRARFTENENVSVLLNIKKPEDPFSIAPMLLMPLVENACKFGLQNGARSFISLSLQVQEDTLKLKLENSTSPSSKAIEGTNSGLALTRQRLKLIYPGTHQLVISNSKGIFTVTLAVILK